MSAFAPQFPGRFPGQFRRLVQPALAAAIETNAWLVAADVQTWQAAYEDIMALAINRGALHLPDKLWFDLRDWISTALVAAITAAEPAVAERRAALTPIFDDIAAHEARLREVPDGG